MKKKAFSIYSFLFLFLNIVASQPWKGKKEDTKKEEKRGEGEEEGEEAQKEEFKL